VRGWIAGGVNVENKYWLDKWQTKDIAFHEQNINADLIAYINKLNLNVRQTIVSSAEWLIKGVL